MSQESFEGPASVQRLVTDIAKVQRNHRIPGTDRRENVIEHTFASAMIGWWVHEELGLTDLDMGKVFKYILVHDFTERGLTFDFNAYAIAGDREAKAHYEQEQLHAIVKEFGNFGDFTTTLVNYQLRADNEAWFAQTIEKMQAVILDQIDGWRAHESIGASYDDYCAHHHEVIENCYPPVRVLLEQVVEYGRQTFYDQPG